MKYQRGTSIMRNMLKTVDPSTSIIVNVVRLPTGFNEVIINTHALEEKAEYLLNTYDDNMVMRNNPNIWIVDMIII